MRSPSLRDLIPWPIIDGAAFRADGIAVGLVVGGAPCWDLTSTAELKATAKRYHELLRTLPYVVTTWFVDQVVSLESVTRTLIAAADRATHPTQQAILWELAEETDRAGQGVVMTPKQVIWAVTPLEPSVAARGGFFWQWLARYQGEPTAADTPSQLLQAQALARDWANRLRGAIAGSPAPELLEREAIARLLLQQLDPVRARQFPPPGSILGQVASAIAPGTAMEIEGG